jgi:hypothetical protein
MPVIIGIPSPAIIPFVARKAIWMQKPAKGLIFFIHII